MTLSASSDTRGQRVVVVSRKQTLGVVGHERKGEVLHKKVPAVNRDGGWSEYGKRYRIFKNIRTEAHPLSLDSGWVCEHRGRVVRAI